MSTQPSSDVFQERLETARQELQNCQQEKNLESCYVCGLCNGCEIRARYVRAVYESMSKGETGGFDF